MNCKSKTCFLVFLGIVFVFSFPKIVFARVVINEFSSNSNPEWVEIYNQTGETVDLSGWKIIDASDTTLSLDGCISSLGFRSFEKNSWLNNSGDTIYLKDNQDNILDQIAYGPDGIIGIPLDGKSAGRDPDEVSNWVIFDSPTKKDDVCVLPSPTSSPTPLPTSTPTLEPVTKAIYKINKAEDGNGNPLSSVKIYIDNNYTHHEDDEILTFCTGCYCDNDKNVPCGLGEHIIKLEREGYSDWSESKNFSAGNDFEVNPILSENSPTVTDIPATPTLTSAPTPTSTPKPTPTPKLSPIPTLSNDLLASEGAEEILGAQTASDGLGIDLNQSASESSENQESKKKFNFWPLVFIVPGLGMISFSVLLLRKQKI